MDNIHPVFQQALRPYMPLTEAEQQVVDMEYIRWKADYHARNDAQALRLQQAEQTRNDFNWAAV